MNKKILTAVLALIMILTVIPSAYAAKEVKEKKTTEVAATTEKPEKTTEKPDKTTEKPERTTEEPVKTTEKPNNTTEKPDKTTEKPDKTTAGKTTENQQKTTVGKTTGKPNESVSEKTTGKSNDSTKNQQRATQRVTVEAIKPTATMRRSDDDNSGRGDVKDYTADSADKALDFRHDPDMTGQFGYFGPTISEGAGSMSESTGLIVNPSNGGSVDLDFSDNDIKAYKYAYIKVKSANKDLPVKFDLKIGNVTLPLNEWKLSNGSYFPATIGLEYKTYALDLRGNGVTELVIHSTDASKEIENKADDYDIRLIGTGEDGAQITIESIVLSDNKPTYKVSVSKKKSLIKRIAMPLLLIAVAIATLVIVNFIIYKKNQHNESMIKRSEGRSSGGYKKRR